MIVLIADRNAVAICIENEGGGHGCVGQCAAGHRKTDSNGAPGTALSPGPGTGSGGRRVAGDRSLDRKFRNTQPWQFIVITDKERLQQISQVRTPINWVADAPLAIAIVLNGDSTISEAYDEGRVSERLLIAAHVLGLGGGTAWFGDDAQQANAKNILGIPAEQTARSVVVIGYPTTTKDHRPNPSTPGRKPLAEIVSYDRFGESR